MIFPLLTKQILLDILPQNPIILHLERDLFLRWYILFLTFSFQLFFFNFYKKSPTIVTADDRVYLVVGGSGGSAIITSVAQVILSVFAFEENIYDAITSPRIHDQLM